MQTTDPMTDDGRIIDTLSEYLPRIKALGEGPALDEDTLGSHGTMSVGDTKGTEYGDHLRALHAILEDLGEELQSHGNVRHTTVENGLNYTVPDCDFLIETNPNLTWSRDLLTSPAAEADPDEDYDQASVQHRIVDLRSGNRERLFELHVDYYTTGEVHAAFSVTPGYSASSTSEGHERLTPTSLFDDLLGQINLNDVATELNSQRPFVLSRVLELAGQQDANLSHARAMALSEVGLSNTEISNRLDIGESTVRSYKSKFTTGTRNAERRVISNNPVPKTVLAEADVDITHSLAERWYVCKTVVTSTYDQQNPYSLVTVKEDMDSFGADIAVETTNYPSLSSLIDSVYAEETFADDQRAESVRDALHEIPEHKRVEAGFETLPEPSTRLDSRVP